MTQDQIIERGLAAASLLSDPTFQSVIQALCYEQFCVFQETKPEDKQGRENSYNLYQGLKAIEAELNARVQAKDEAAKAIDAINADQDDLDGPIYIQGDNNQ
jgi:hypothetical protein